MSWRELVAVITHHPKQVSGVPKGKSKSKRRGYAVLLLYALELQNHSLFPTTTISFFFSQMAKSRNSAYGKAKPPSLTTKPSKNGSSSGSSASSPVSSVAPKTPADEGIEFFQSEVRSGETPIHVYDLRLDVDGGPHKDRSVESLCSLYQPFLI